VKLALLADIHAANHKQHGGPVEAGLNYRARLIVETLKRAADAARECAGAVVLGDLFDSTRPPPPLIRAVGQALEGFGWCDVILGNHDRSSDAVDDNAAAPLAFSESIQVVGEPRHRVVNDQDGTLLLVPFLPGPARKWLPGVVEGLGLQPRHRKRVLCLHLGIWDESTAPFLKDSNDSVPLALIEALVEKHQLEAVVAGNWHQRRTWRVGPRKVPVAVLGTTCPVNFGDEKSDGKIGILDFAGERVALRFTDVPGPRWYTVELDGLLSFDPTACDAGVFVRCSVKPEDLAAATARRLELEAAGARVSITIDSSGLKRQAAAAASVARSASSFETAVAGYVDANQVREPGTVTGVLRRLAEYRRLAG